jgi:energy-coupling factor transport system permease protein
VLDPRTKFLATVGLIAATFLTRSLVYFAGIFGVFVIVFLRSKTPLRVVLRNVLLLSWLLVFTFVAQIWGQIFFAPQETTLPTFSLGGMLITYQGLTEGVLAIGQLVVVVGWVSILGCSTSPMELIAGLESLLRSLRLRGIQIQKLSIVTMLSMRFIPILFEESQHLVRAYIARGIDLHAGNLVVRLKNYVMLCAPLFNSMLRRADHLTLAMESRAFQARAERTSLYTLRLRCRDYFALAGIFAILVGTQVIP